jgi:hypothetical protein
MCCCCIDCLCSGVFKSCSLLAWCLSCGFSDRDTHYSRFDAHNSPSDIEQLGGERIRTNMSDGNRCQNCMGWTATIAMLIMIIATFGMSVAILVIVSGLVTTSDIQDIGHVLYGRGEESFEPVERDVAATSLREGAQDDDRVDPYSMGLIFENIMANKAPDTGVIPEETSAYYDCIDIVSSVTSKNMMKAFEADGVVFEEQMNLFCASIAALRNIADCDDSEIPGDAPIPSSTA